MNGYNKVILIGNVVYTPETRCTQSGAVILDNVLAVNEYRKDSKGARVDDTTFIPFTMYNKTAETAGKYLTKGSRVLIEGKLRISKWEKDGQKQSRPFVMVETMNLLGGDKPKPEEKQEPEPRPTREEKRYEDIPF